MAYYFVNSRNEQDGPVEVDQFAAYGITENTLLWRAGLSKWTRGRDLPELAEVFAPAPPAAPAAPEPAPVQRTVLAREEVPAQPAEQPYEPAAPAQPAYAGDDYDYLDPPVQESHPAPTCHLGKAIAGLIMMSCFYIGPFGGFALGIASIILNVFAYNNWKKGNYSVADRLERKARGFGIASLIVGIVSVVLLFVYIFVIAAAVSHSHSYYYY